MSNNRRQFLKQLSASGLASAIPFSTLFAFSEGNDNGFVINEEDQETYLIGGRNAPVTFLVDKNSKKVDTISMCREDIIPEDGIPVHKHLNEEEIIYIQSGSGKFTLGEKVFQLNPGSVAFVPKGVWHGLSNNGTENIRMLFSFSPSGFENYFREIGIPKGGNLSETPKIDWPAVNKKYGIVYK